MRRCGAWTLAPPFVAAMSVIRTTTLRRRVGSYRSGVRNEGTFLGKTTPQRRHHHHQSTVVSLLLYFYYLHPPPDTPSFISIPSVGSIPKKIKRNKSSQFDVQALRRRSSTQPYTPQRLFISGFYNSVINSQITQRPCRLLHGNDEIPTIHPACNPRIMPNNAIAKIYSAKRALTKAVTTPPTRPRKYSNRS